MSNIPIISPIIHSIVAFVGEALDFRVSQVTFSWDFASWVSDLAFRLLLEVIIIEAKKALVDRMHQVYFQPDMHCPCHVSCFLTLLSSSTPIVSKFSLPACQQICEHLRIFQEIPFLLKSNKFLNDTIFLLKFFFWF